MYKSSWIEKAACQGQLDKFYIPPSEGDDEELLTPVQSSNRRATALKICAGCPVQAECRQDMLTWDFPPTNVVVAGLGPAAAGKLWREHNPEYALQVNRDYFRSYRKEQRQHGNRSNNRVRSRG